MTESGFLVVRASLTLVCDPGSGWSARFLVTLLHDASHADVRDLDHDQHWLGGKVPTEVCVPDLSTCHVPEWVWTR